MLMTLSQTFVFTLKLLMMLSLYDSLETAHCK